MENKIVLEAILKPYNMSLAKRKEFASKLDLPSNTQNDLMFMSAVLVSTGTNKNGATFLGSELIKARGTIIQKPLDIEHEEPKIIGHIASCIFMDFNGNIINDEDLYNKLHASIDNKVEYSKVSKELDSMNMDIGIVCAVYKDRFPEIATEIGEGQWKVSMECYYKDYDVKIGSMILPKGLASESIITDRELKAELDQVTVGNSLGTVNVSRVLREIAFCGVGIVKNPANDRSIILEAASTEQNKLIILEAASVENINVEKIEDTIEKISSIKEEIVMKNEVEKETSIEAAAFEKEKIIPPKNLDELPNVTMTEPKQVDMSNIDIHTSEILNILWLQVYEQNPTTPEEIITNNRSETYFDPVGNRRNFRHEAYALKSKKLFLMNSKESVEQMSKMFSFVIDKLTSEEKIEFYNNLVTMSMVYGADINNSTEIASKNNIIFSNLKELSEEYALPRLQLLPLTSREQIIAAMSRCLHIKANLTDKEKEYMVVNILKAAQKFNIDVSLFRNRIKKLNY